MAAMAGACKRFLGVSVKIPSEQVDKSEEAVFVTLGSGRLDVQPDGAIELHLPRLDPKALGYLSRASAVPQDEAGCSLDIKVICHSSLNLYRFVFNSSLEAVAFASLAEKAMVQDFNECTATESAQAEESTKFLLALKNCLSGRRPVICGGMQLVGPDPLGEDGCEVLLCAGALAILDPFWGSDKENSQQVGEYELLFYGEEEGTREPVKRLSIGPKMSLERQDRKRTTLDEEEEPAETFTLTMMGGPGFTITFDSIEVANNFERDFAVRQRLMDVALKTAKNQRELSKTKQRSILAPLVVPCQVALCAPALVLLLAMRYQWAASSMCTFLLP
jgi:hypothetical protein